VLLQVAQRLFHGLAHRRPTGEGLDDPEGLATLQEVGIVDDVAFDGQDVVGIGVLLRIPGSPDNASNVALAHLLRTQESDGGFFAAGQMNNAMEVQRDPDQLQTGLRVVPGQFHGDVPDAVDVAHVVHHVFGFVVGSYEVGDRGELEFIHRVAFRLGYIGRTIYNSIYVSFCQ